MMEIDENTLDLKSHSYADAALESKNPMIANTTYKRSVKMSSPCFRGTDIEEAYKEGYRAAWKDKQELKPSKEYYRC